MLNATHPLLTNVEMMSRSSKTQKVATLKDVARAAAVSTATVSRCLNMPQCVGEKTRARVLKAVADLSYSPNFGAQIMAARRTNTIGAVIPTMENSIFAQGIQAFQEELNNYGFTLLVASSSYKPDVEAAQVKNLIARGAEGLLLIGLDRDEEVYQFISNRGLPLVLTWAYDAQTPHHTIGFDNQKAMEELTEMVIRLGHRRIGSIITSTTHNDRARARLDGIKSAMARHHLSADQLTVLETPYSIANGAKYFEELMQQSNPPSVVICGNDVLAVGALMKAKEMGLRVPEDVSITGFDDIELARVVEPRLTTVHVPHGEMGKRAAAALIGHITASKSLGGEQLETHICRGATLGPA